MSLAEAVKSIADTMEKDAEGLGASFMKGYVIALRAAVEAAKGNPSQDTSFFAAMNKEMNEKIVENRKKRANKELEERISFQEMDEEGFGAALLVGGASDGVVMPTTDIAPVGAQIVVGGQVYQKQANGQWVYTEKT